ncbi:hypothetical protein BC828DRAFT_409928 [Blastocladiella britannica]|nr:hypothetical protein BC828DRAFT_409928 [Blastocladiella britannica]
MENRQQSKPAVPPKAASRGGAAARRSILVNSSTESPPPPVRLLKAPTSSSSTAGLAVPSPPPPTSAATTTTTAARPKSTVAPAPTPPRTPRSAARRSLAAPAASATVAPPLPALPSPPPPPTSREKQQSGTKTPTAPPYLSAPSRPVRVLASLSHASPWRAEPLATSLMRDSPVPLVVGIVGRQCPDRALLAAAVLGGIASSATKVPASANAVPFAGIEVRMAVDRTLVVDSQPIPFSPFQHQTRASVVAGNKFVTTATRGAFSGTNAGTPGTDSSSADLWPVQLCAWMAIIADVVLVAVGPDGDLDRDLFHVVRNGLELARKLGRPNDALASIVLVQLNASPRHLTPRAFAQLESSFSADMDGGPAFRANAAASQPLRMPEILFPDWPLESDAPMGRIGVFVIPSGPPPATTAGVSTNGDDDHEDEFPVSRRIALSALVDAVLLGPWIRVGRISELDWLKGAGLAWDSVKRSWHL